MLGGISGSFKSATEVAKSVGCEVTTSPWWPSLKLKFNHVLTKGNGKNTIYSAGAANQNTPKTYESASEELVENTFFCTFSNLAAKAEAENVYWQDTHARKWLKRPHMDASLFAPDGVCFAVRPEGDLDARYVIGINDNKASRDHGAFSNDDRGKLLRYLGIVMEHYQKDRISIGGSLYDGQYAQCFLLNRLPAFGHHVWKLECSTVMDCATQVGAQLFAGFLCSKRAMGWVLQDIPEYCGKFLGSGSIGYVFAHKTENAVVKISRTESIFWLVQERKALVLLNTLPGIIHLSERDAGGDSPLILTPLLQAICPWHRTPPIDLQQLARLIDGPVKALHEKFNYVHCDLRPENIMCYPPGSDQEGCWVLIDFGSCRPSGSPLMFEHGTLSFASSAVRKAYQEHVAVAITAADDLESLVYVAFVLTQMTPAAVASDIFSLKSDLAQLTQFWESNLGLRKRWHTLLCAARRGDHDGVAVLLRDMNDFRTVAEE